jgi:hypothetical protein
MKLQNLIELETNPYNYLAFKLVINPNMVEKFILDNNIDLRAFITGVKKSNNTQLKDIKNIINGKADIYTKNQFIQKFGKN